MAVTDSLGSLIEFVSDAPLNSLNNACRRKIGMFLDQEGSLIQDTNLFNDWCGLAELLNFTNTEIENFKRQRYPTQEVLHQWTTRRDPEPTVVNLIRFLLQLERGDIITECRTMIERDVEKHRANEKSLKDINNKEWSPNPRPGPATYHDVVSVDEQRTGYEIYYDCFVIYNPDASDQVEFVKQMSRILEGPEYNLRLFIPWRDDLVGTAAHSVSAAIIEKKCRRCAVIISKSFNNSPAADFQLKFSHALSPGARQKRVIPILIERCEVPSILNFVAQANFYNPGIRDWQWPRIVATIKSDLVPDPITWLPETDAWNIALDTSDTTQRGLWGLTVAAQTYPDQEPEPIPSIDIDRKKKNKLSVSKNFNSH